MFSLIALLFMDKHDYFPIGYLPTCLCSLILIGKNLLKKKTYCMCPKIIIVLIVSCQNDDFPDVHWPKWQTNFIFPIVHGKNNVFYIVCYKKRVFSLFIVYGQD
jgi:hypothetical protein